ncbi:MAG: hypothetical protein CMJ83_14405 [Planctomycetes bacterium]|nr:hypothetical protein [Planctomycetota bacterium]
MLTRVVLLVLATTVMGSGSATMAQIQVCDGRNHTNQNTTGSWGLPAARTLGVRIVLATAVPVERVEWFFSPSSLTTQLGGTVAILQEAGTTGLPSTAVAGVLGSVQWSSPQVAPAWAGGAFAAPVMLAAGVPYWVTTTASPTVTHQAVSYDDSGPDPTTYAVATGGNWVLVSTPHRFKVRLLSTSCATAPEYQVNQAEASAAVNGVQGTAAAPATVTVGIGQSAVVALASSLAGAPWDAGLTVGPLVPASGGGFIIGGGQIVNLDPTDPTLTFLFSPPFTGPPFVNFSVPLNTSSALTLSFQLAVIDPAAPSNVWLSQPNRLMVQ